MNRWLRGLACTAALMVMFSLGFAISSGVALAHDAVPHGTAVNALVGFDQLLDNRIPTELSFRNERGEAVQLGHYLGDKPIILALSYFECETLCPLVRHGLVEALRPMSFVAGDEFDVVLVSIDPEERAEDAYRIKQETVEAYGRAGSDTGWHLLTGDHDEIDALAAAIGFRYAYDGEQDEYAHPSGVVVVTPDARVARYFFGIEYNPQDLRFGLVEAAENRIGSLVDQLLLLCYHYDPTVGKYSLVIMNVLRGAGLLTVVILGSLIFFLRQREVQPPGGPPAASLG